MFGEYLCNQLSATGDFVDETVANAGGALAGWRKRVADTADGVWDQVYCIISGACPLA